MRFAREKRGAIWRIESVLHLYTYIPPSCASHSDHRGEGCAPCCPRLSDLATEKQEAVAAPRSLHNDYLGDGVGKLA